MMDGDEERYGTFIQVSQVILEEFEEKITHFDVKFMEDHQGAIIKLYGCGFFGLPSHPPAYIHEETIPVHLFV